MAEWAFARWGDTGFLGSAGDFFVLADVSVLQQRLPLLLGPPDSRQQVFQQYLAARRLLQPAGLSIQSMQVNQRNAWQLQLNNGWQVYLGRRHMEDNLQRLVQVVHKVLKARAHEVDIVDMRYENGYAVVWKQESDKLPLSSELAASDVE